MPVEPKGVENKSKLLAPQKAKTGLNDSTATWSLGARSNMSPLLTDAERTEAKDASFRRASLPPNFKHREVGFQPSVVFKEASELQYFARASPKLNRRNSLLACDASVTIGDFARVTEEMDEPLDDAEKSTTSEAVVSIANTMVGAGMLSIPFGIRAAGGLGGFVIVCIVCATLSFTGFCIGWAYEHPKVIAEFEKNGASPFERDFSALANIAAGPKFATFISLAFAAEVWLGSEAYLVLLGCNLEAIFGWNKTYVIVGCAAVGFSLLYVSMKVLAYVSMISMGAILAAIGTLLWSGLLIPESPEYGEFHALVRPEGLLTCLGMSLFCFAGHPCLPSIYWNMKDPQKDWPAACSGGFILAAIFYMGVSGIGYYFYGDFLEQSFMSNLGRDLSGDPLPATDILGLMIDPRWLTVATSLAMSIKLQGGLPFLQMCVLAVPESGFSKDQQIARLAIRMVFVAVSILVAIFFQDAVAELATILGCALTMTTSVFFPPVMLLRIAGSELSIPMRALLSAIACFGVGFGITGTYQAILSAISGKG